MVGFVCDFFRLGVINVALLPLLVSVLSRFDAAKVQRFFGWKISNLRLCHIEKINNTRNYIDNDIVTESVPVNSLSPDR